MTAAAVFLLEAKGGCGWKEREKKEACVPTWAQSLFRPPRALRSKAGEIKPVPRERLFYWDKRRRAPQQAKQRLQQLDDYERSCSRVWTVIQWAELFHLCCRRSYVDDGVFEFDVKSVVGDGDDGIVRSTQKLHPLALQDRERDLERQRQQYGIEHSYRTERLAQKFISLCWFVFILHI